MTGPVQLIFPIGALINAVLVAALVYWIWRLHKEVKHNNRLIEHVLRKGVQVPYYPSTRDLVRDQLRELDEIE